VSGSLARIQNWEELGKNADFCPDKLAANCLVSLRHLERFFQDQFHTTPRLWLRAVQCQRAKELLARGYSSKAISTDLKFANPTHFCREFRKVFGAQPRTFAPKPVGARFI
jgi:AraC-like DNA-binding protein